MTKIAVLLGIALITASVFFDVQVNGVLTQIVKALIYPY